MEKKFTPGPWKYEEQPIKEHGFYIETVEQDQYNTFIGEAGGGLQDLEEVRANAKLISAAPDLLDACIIAYVSAEPAIQSILGEAIKKALK